MSSDVPHDLVADTHLPDWVAEDFDDPKVGGAIVKLARAVEALAGLLSSSADASVTFAKDGSTQRTQINATLTRINERLDHEQKERASFGERLDREETERKKREEEAKKTARISSSGITRGNAIDVEAIQRHVEEGVRAMTGIAAGMREAHAHHAMLLGAKPISSAPDEKARKGFGLLADVHDLKSKGSRAMEWFKGLGAGVGIAVAAYELLHKVLGH